VQRVVGRARQAELGLDVAVAHVAHFGGEGAVRAQEAAVEAGGVSGGGRRGGGARSGGDEDEVWQG
jgi:hypothetical protein